MTVTESEPVAATVAEPRPDWWKRRYTFTGTAVGLLFVLLTMTPSLLPRGPLFQGLLSGLAGAIGYGLGVFAVWLIRFMRSRPTSPPAPRWAWPILVIVGAIELASGVWYFHYWQNHVRDLMGVPQLQWFNYLQAAVLSVIFLFTFVELGQLVGRLVRFLVRQLNRVAPPRVSVVAVIALLIAVNIAIINGIVVRDGSDPARC